MNAVRGYFDGTSCVPFEKADFELNEEVLIVPLKRRANTSEIIDRYFGSLDDSSAKAAMEAMEICRKMEADEWKSPSLGMLKFRGSKVWEGNLDEMRGW